MARRMRRPRPRGIGLWWPLLLALLAAGVIIGPRDTAEALQLANPDQARISQLRAVLDGLPSQPLVLVAMDADLGSYPEIRPTVRAALDDLLRRNASLAFVSVTGDGRAIAAAELARLLALGVREGALLDLGFVAGVEAGLVRLVSAPVPSGVSGPAADRIADRGGSMAAFDMALLVGGIDVGPRSWVEQVGTRLPDLPMVAVAPTFAQPELAPYLRTGQLVALLATVRDGAAYAAAVAADRPTPLPDEPQRDRVPSSLAMLLGMLAALLVIGRQLAGSLPALAARAPAEPAEDDWS
jgi:hypothetical protein